MGVPRFLSQMPRVRLPHRAARGYNPDLRSPNKEPAMWGTILNAITVLFGSALGLMLGGRLPARIQESVITGLGFVTAYVGLSNAGETGNVIIPLIALVTGAIVGELLSLDRRLDGFAGRVQARFEGNDSPRAEDRASARPTQIVPQLATEGHK